MKILPTTKSMITHVLSTVLIALISVTLVSGAACGGTSKAASHYLEGERLLDAGKIDDAIAEFYQALALKPSSVQTKKQLMRAQGMQVSCLYREVMDLAKACGASTRQEIKSKILEAVERLNTTSPYGANPAADDPENVLDLTDKAAKGEAKRSEFDELIRLQADCAAVLRREASTLRMCAPPKTETVQPVGEGQSDDYVPLRSVIAECRTAEDRGRRSADAGATQEQAVNAWETALERLPRRRVQWKWTVVQVNDGGTVSRNGGPEVQYYDIVVDCDRQDGCYVMPWQPAVSKFGLLQLPISGGQAAALSKGTKLSGRGITTGGIWVQPAQVEIPGAGWIELRELPPPHCSHVSCDETLPKDSGWTDKRGQPADIRDILPFGPYLNAKANVDTIRRDRNLTEVQKNARMAQLASRTSFALPLLSIFREDGSGKYTVRAAGRLALSASKTEVVCLKGDLQMPLSAAQSLKIGDVCSFTGSISVEYGSVQLRGTLRLPNNYQVPVVDEQWSSM